MDGRPIPTSLRMLSQVLLDYVCSFIKQLTILTPSRSTKHIESSVGGWPCRRILDLKSGTNLWHALSLAIAQHYCVIRLVLY